MKAFRLSMIPVAVALMLSVAMAGAILGPMMLAERAQRRDSWCPTPAMRSAPVDASGLDDLELIRDTPEPPPAPAADEPGLHPSEGK